MKKIFTIFAVALALVSGLLLASCSDDDDDEFFGPSNTWCELPITQKMEDGNEKTIGYIAAVYCDELYTSDGTGSSELKKDEKLDAGITFVVWCDRNIDDSTISGSVLAGLSKSAYVKKTFSKATETDVPDSTDDNEKMSIIGSKATWKLIYVSKFHNGSKLELPKAPAVLLSSSIYSDASETVQNFSWKKILKQYLISSLD